MKCIQGGVIAKRKRIAELREKYVEDERALRQLDSYDPDDNEHHRKVAEFREALKADDLVKIRQLEVWFEENEYELY